MAAQETGAGPPVRGNEVGPAAQQEGPVIGAGITIPNAPAQVARPITANAGGQVAGPITAPAGAQMAGPVIVDVAADVGVPVVANVAGGVVGPVNANVVGPPAQPINIANIVGAFDIEAGLLGSPPRKSNIAFHMHSRVQ